ncbi:hypothetical protein K439DRAFT_201483 [Ramaria rubella]|nr:hypothetical protein K439DRAFT_201483 [Ramaria rubella]
MRHAGVLIHLHALIFSCSPLNSCLLPRSSGHNPSRHIHVLFVVRLHPLQAVAAEGTWWLRLYASRCARPLPVFMLPPRTSIHVAWRQR